jgi:hypothetical protein
MFCKYKNIFGKEDKGIHSYRLFNLAIVDVLVTIIIAYIFYLIFPNINFIYILLCLFILGIILHRIFCVRTTIDKLLFE